MGRGTRQPTSTSTAAPPRRLTLSEEIVKLYTVDKLTLAEIKERLGVPRETVRGNLIRAQVPRRAARARNARNAEEVASAVRMYVQDRRTLLEIGYELGRSASTVSSWLVAEGVELRAPGVAPDRDSVSETVRLYTMEQLTISQCAERQGLHEWTIRERLIKEGVPRRRPGRPKRSGDSAP